MSAIVRENLVDEFRNAHNPGRVYPAAQQWDPDHALGNAKPLAECIANALVNGAQVLDRYDPSSGLPAGPSDSDRYIATATANGWTEHRIYEWSAGSSSWVEYTPQEGWMVWVLDEDVHYTFDGSAWGTIGGITPFQTDGTRVGLGKMPDHLFDVDDSGTLALLGAVTDGVYLHSVSGLFVEGAYLYACAGPDHRVSIYDITDPSAPALIGAAYDADLRPADIVVRGQYAYVACGQSHRFAIIDISDAANPTVVAKLHDGSVLNDARFMDVQGMYAYLLANGADRLTVVNISDPQSPFIAGSVTHATYLRNPYGLKIRGKYAYTCSMYSDCLTIIDIADPSSPSVIGYRIDNTELNAPQDLVVRGKYAYVACYIGGRLTVVDIEDPTSPSVEGSLTGLDYPLSMAICGDYVYMSWVSSDYRIEVIDVGSNPTSPSLVGGIDVAWRPKRMVFSGNRLYASLNPTHTVNVYDTSGVRLPSVQAGVVKCTSLESEETVYANNISTRGGTYCRSLLAESSAAIGENLDVGGCVTVRKGAVSGAVARRVGATTTEGYEEQVIDETVVLTNAVAEDLTQDIPAGAVLLCVQANLETAVTGDGSGDNALAAVGIGVSGDPDKYGETGSLAQNQKVDTIPAHAVLSGAEDIQVYATDGAGNAVTEKFTAGGEVRVRIVFAAPNSLDDA